MRAEEYFQSKLDFTTGPIEVNRDREAGKIVVVDVRRAEDYAKGHIPGAINLPKEEWASPHGLSKEKANVVYCYSQTCHLAAAAALEWAAQGYPVKEMEGGFRTWESAKLPVESSQPEVAAATR
jgi:rhodanese-related sulfurtransferase